MREPLAMGTNVQAVKARLALNDEKLELANAHLAVWEQASRHLDALQV